MAGLKRLIEFRKFMSWSQTQMAEFLGMDLASYKNYEYKTTGTPEVILRIAERLHVSTDWLLGRRVEEMWDTCIRDIRRALCRELQRMPEFQVFDDRVSWIIQWLLDQDVCSLEPRFLAGVLFVPEDKIMALANREPEFRGEGPGPIVLERLAQFLNLRTDWILTGQGDPVDRFDGWRCVVTQLEAEGISPTDVMTKLGTVVNAIKRTGKIPGP